MPARISNAGNADRVTRGREELDCQKGSFDRAIYGMPAENNSRPIGTLGVLLVAGSPDRFLLERVRLRARFPAEGTLGTVDFRRRELLAPRFPVWTVALRIGHDRNS